jgi:branched-subunit amino acid transport protein AzlD
MNFLGKLTRTNEMQINRENQLVRIPLQWLSACVLGALVAAGASADEEANVARPNIIVIMVDNCHHLFQRAELSTDP